MSRESVSRVTDSVVEEMEAWRQRPLNRIYPLVFIDALVMKIRQGRVANRPGLRLSQGPQRPDPRLRRPDHHLAISITPQAQTR
ncbi:transposase [Micromonospora chalcea]|uniref:transposase n=1 Tax=Micromonospora chalcea TaxID=1874 RepID=UPI00343F5682